MRWNKAETDNLSNLNYRRDTLCIWHETTKQYEQTMFIYGIIQPSDNE